MFYNLNKGAELLERFNVPAGENGKALDTIAADAAALARANEVGADSVTDNTGRAVK